MTVTLPQIPRPVHRPAIGRSLLFAAIEYHHRHWTCFPLRDKVPAVPRWSHFRDEENRPTIEQVREWFNRNRDAGLVNGIAVITGKPSGGLCVRDFDQVDAYRRWAAANPELARSLPTSRTGRGFHVWFRSECSIFRRLPDGELIGNSGHYVVAPPSYHPDRRALYTWTVQLPPTGKPLPNIDAIEAGLLPEEEGRRLGPGSPGAGSPTQARRPDALISGLHSVLDLSLPAIVARVLPDGPGQRHHALLAFVRALDAAGVGREQLRAAFDLWYAAALGVIRTRSYKASWEAFVDMWERSQKRRAQGKAEGCLDEVLAIAGTIAVPAEFARPTALGRLFQICAAFDRHGSGHPFFYPVQRPPGWSAICTTSPHTGTCDGWKRLAFLNW